MLFPVFFMVLVNVLGTMTKVLHDDSRIPARASWKCRQTGKSQPHKTRLELSDFLHL